MTLLLLVPPCPAVSGFLALVWGSLMYDRLASVYKGTSFTATLGACFYLTIVAILVNAAITFLLYRANALPMVLASSAPVGQPVTVVQDSAHKQQVRAALPDGK